MSTPKHADCLHRKKQELAKLEHKVDTGLDRTLNALVGWVRTILSTDQKKTDFNPPMTNGPNKHVTGLAQASPACLRVVKFVNHQVSFVAK